MKLKHLLFEGRYDKITGLLTKKVMEYVKTTVGKKSYQGYQIVYDNKPTFSPDDGNDVATVVDDVTGMEVDLMVSIARVKAMGNKFSVTGYALSKEGAIAVIIYLGDVDEPKIYSKLLPELKNMIRHEVEHLTQMGFAENPAKKRKFSWGARASYRVDPSKSWKYYILADEIDANLHGLYAQAKNEKIPFKDMVYRFLDELIGTGNVTDQQASTIYSKYKKRAKEIGGLPPL